MYSSHFDNTEGPLHLRKLLIGKLSGLRDNTCIWHLQHGKCTKSLIILGKWQFFYENHQFFISRCHNVFYGSYAHLILLITSITVSLTRRGGGGFSTGMAWFGHGVQYLVSWKALNSLIIGDSNFYIQTFQKVKVEIQYYSVLNFKLVHFKQL